MLSLCLTQLVLDHKLTSPEKDNDLDFNELNSHYGSLARTMLSLFQAVSGGLDWEVLINPLMLHISVWLAPLFSLYIAFTLLAMMNVVTAVFVESVLESTKKDKNIFMVNNVRELFETVDGGIHTGSMDWDNGGSVDAEEFLSGCLRLRGPAKAIDLALLI